ETSAGAVEGDAADAAVGQRRLQLAVPRHVYHRQSMHAVDIRHPGDETAVVAAFEGVDIPRYVPAHDLDRAGHQVDAAQLLEIAVPVGDQVDAASVGREARGGDARGVRALAHRRQCRGGDVHDVQVSLGGRDVIVDE